MEEVFRILVNRSITAGWLILALIGLRPLMRRMPKWVVCALWGLVVLRLVCPVSVGSAVSLIPSAEPLPREILTSPRPEIRSGIAAVDEAVNPKLGTALAPAVGASANPAQVWWFVLARVWAVGVGVMMLCSLGSLLHLKRRVATAVPAGRGIKRSEYISTPFVMGLFRPVIYLPAGIPAEDVPHIFAHERAHIQRGDPWWKLLGFLLLSVWWFQPLAWAAYSLFCRDIEAACDEKVVRGMEPDGRRAYASTLLNCSIRRPRGAGVPLAFGEVGVKTRVKRVMRYRRPGFLAGLGALVLCVILAVCFLTDPKGEHPQELSISVENVTPEGLTVIYHPEQSFQKADAILNGYWLEAFDGEQWIVPEPNRHTNPDVKAAIEPKGDRHYLDWSLAYGPLPAGKYRIVLELDDLQSPESRKYYAEFFLNSQ